MWFLPRLTLRTGLAAIAGLVEELVLSTAGVLGTSKHTTHLRGTERQAGGGHSEQRQMLNTYEDKISQVQK